MFNPCEMCNAACCKDYLITATSFDILRIIEETGKDAKDFASIQPLRLLSFDDETVLECYEGKIRSDHILALESHPCIFLKSGKCAIHEFAPMGCRTYPYTIGKRFIPRSRCPPHSNLLFRLSGLRADTENYAFELGEYKKLVAKWNKKHGKEKDCLNFLLKESKKIKLRTLLWQ